MKQYIRVLWLPLFLIVLFVLQNHVFNLWLGLTLFYGVRRTIITLGLAVLLFGPAIFWQRRARHLYLGIVSLLVAILFVAQYLYYLYARTFLQASVLRYSGNLGAVRGTIATLLVPELWFFVVNILVILIAYFWLSHPNDPPLQLKGRWRMIAIGFLVLIPVLSYGYVIAKERREQGDISRLYTKLYDAGDLVKKVGIINYSLEDLVKFATRNPKISDRD